MEIVKYISLLFLLSFLFIAMVIGIVLSIDYHITKSRLAKNQKAWDEYSKDMTIKEKREVFPEWLIERKIEMGWDSFYIPRM